MHQFATRRRFLWVLDCHRLLHTSDCYAQQIATHSRLVRVADCCSHFDWSGNCCRYSRHHWCSSAIAVSFEHAVIFPSLVQPTSFTVPNVVLPSLMEAFGPVKSVDGHSSFRWMTTTMTTNYYGLAFHRFHSLREEWSVRQTLFENTLFYNGFTSEAWSGVKRGVHRKLAEGVIALMIAFSRYI